MEKMLGLIVSVQVGRVRHMVMEGAQDFRDRVWESGIYKEKVEGEVRVTAGGMEGDEQADLYNHGGPDNVVLAYDAGHYPVWRQKLEMPELAYGGFGENFTVTGFTDATVCIGDVWIVGGELKLQVTQARQPCFKLARRVGKLQIVKMVMETGWGGWYLRVLQPGVVRTGLRIELESRLHPKWPVARAVQVMYRRKVDPGEARELASLPELSKRWKAELVE